MGLEPESQGSLLICRDAGFVGPSGPTVFVLALLARQMARDPGSRADALRSGSLEVTPKRQPLDALRSDFHDISALRTVLLHPLARLSRRPPIKHGSSHVKAATMINDGPILGSGFPCRAGRETRSCGVGDGGGG